MIALALGAIVSLGAVQLFDATQRSARAGRGAGQGPGKWPLCPPGISSRSGAKCRACTLHGARTNAAQYSAWRHGDQPPPRFALRAALGGYNGGRQGFAPALTGNDLGLEETHLRDGSDVLVVRGFQGKGLRLVSEMSQPSAVLFTEIPADPTLFASGRYYSLATAGGGRSFSCRVLVPRGKAFASPFPGREIPLPGTSPPISILMAAPFLPRPRYGPFPYAAFYCPRGR